MSEKVIVGIDLGTTNTCVALKTKMGFEVIENLTGDRITPSVVAFLKEGEVVVGNYAKSMQASNPGRVIYGAKRLIGHKRGDEDVEHLFKNALFKIDYDDLDNPVVVIPKSADDKKRVHKPEEIAALVLGEVTRIIKNKTGKGIDECIITVPAYFNDLQRKSTKIAAEIAKIPCIRLFNEPTAAAIAYQDKVKFNNGNVLVYDFGGGTLDVSILNVRDNDFTVLAVSGNTSLGGEDIDAILVDEMIKRFKRQHPDSDPRSKPNAIARLKMVCEEAKCRLSSSLETSIVIGNFVDGFDLNEKLTRQKLEFLCDEIFDKITEPIDIALEDASAKRGGEDIQIDNIIMVGGSSKIPYVIKTVADYFDNKIKPLTTVDPSEAVALGAAIICSKYSNKKIINGNEEHQRVTVQTRNADEGLIRLVEVQPISIGVMHVDRSGRRLFRKFINRNQPLPQSNEYTFTTFNERSKFANIEIYQGEEDEITATSHLRLGKFKLSGLPPRRSRDVIITVTLSVDEGGILKVTAKCNEPGVSPINLVVHTDEIYKDGEMEEAIREIEEINDRKELSLQYDKVLVDLGKAISDARNRGMSVTVYEKFYNNLASSKPATKEALTTAIENIKKTIDKLK